MQRPNRALSWRLAMIAAVAMSGLPGSVAAETAGGSLPKQVGKPDPRQTWADQERDQQWATDNLSRSPRKHEWLTLRLGDRVLRAFVTYPEKRDHAPVVLVLHEVFGLTASTLNTADQISAMGAITIAPDMLSGFAPNGNGTGGFASTHEAADFITLLPDASVNAQINAWAEFGLHDTRSDGNLSIVGLSWGGGAAFRYAASGVASPNLRSVHVFYDVGPPTVTQGPGRFAQQTMPVSVDRIQVPIYGFYPSGDQRVMQSLPATQQSMKSAGKRFEPVTYHGAEHAYMRLGADPRDTNPANSRAVAASLERLRSLLAPL